MGNFSSPAGHGTVSIRKIRLRNSKAFVTNYLRHGLLIPKNRTLMVLNVWEEMIKCYEKLSFKGIEKKFICNSNISTIYKERT